MFVHKNFCNLEFCDCMHSWELYELLGHISFNLLNFDHISDIKIFF